MGHCCGIIGLPNVGKSLLFKLLSRQKNISSQNYPFCTIEPNIGIVVVPDDRLQVLYDIFRPVKPIVYQYIKFIDIAGLVAGASKGAGLGNKFLSNVREADVLLHVVRCFESDEIIHVLGKVDPVRDAKIINSEIILSDLEQIENILSKKKKGRSKELEVLLNNISQGLIEGVPIRKQGLLNEELDFIKEYGLLSNKPMLYLMNISEDLMNNDKEQQIINKFLNEMEESKASVIPIAISIEEEIANIEDVNLQKSYFKEFGLMGTSLSRVVRSVFKLMNYTTFFTVGHDEVRAWTIYEGDSVLVAAEKIHTDLANGFVRAEVISYEDMIKYGNILAAKQDGIVRYEGKKYIIQNGDVVNILAHN